MYLNIIRKFCKKNIYKIIMFIDSKGDNWNLIN